MSKAIVERPNIFNYEALRPFLEDMVFFLKHAKKIAKTKIVKRAGFGSPSYLKMIMDGERNLSIPSASKLAKALELERDEAEYFLLLTRFEQSSDQIARESFRQNLQRFRDFYDLKEVDRDHYDLFYKWYNTAILEYVGSVDEDWNIQGLSKELNITSKETEEALALLERLGLIAKENGRWRKTSASIQTPKHVESKALYCYTREMILQGLRNLDVDDHEKRNFQGLTVALTKEQFRQLSERIWNFLSEVNKETNDTRNPDGIYQLNVQLFSLLQRDKDR